MQDLFDRDLGLGGINYYDGVSLLDSFLQPHPTPLSPGLRDLIFGVFVFSTIIAIEQCLVNNNSQIIYGALTSVSLSCLLVMIDT